MKTFLWGLVLLVSVGWVWAGGKSHLRPAVVPPALVAESNGTEVIFEGICERKSEPTICVVGYQASHDRLWVLFFTDQGVLFEVININRDEREVMRWQHPNLLA